MEAQTVTCRAFCAVKPLFRVIAAPLHQHAPAAPAPAPARPVYTIKTDTAPLPPTLVAMPVRVIIHRPMNRGSLSRPQAQASHSPPPHHTHQSTRHAPCPFAPKAHVQQYIQAVCGHAETHGRLWLWQRVPGVPRALRTGSAGDLSAPSSVSLPAARLHNWQKDRRPPRSPFAIPLHSQSGVQLLFAACFCGQLVAGTVRLSPRSLGLASCRMIMYSCIYSILK